MTVEYQSEHVTEALSFLLEQFRGSTNLQAIISSYAQQIQDLEDAFEQLLNDRSLDTATGIQLDGIGQILGRARGGLDDETYRVVLKVQAKVNTAPGGIDKWILRIVELLIPDSTAVYTEFQPASFQVEITDPVLTELSNGVPLSLVWELINQARPAGVGFNLVTQNSENSFQFAEDNPPENTPVVPVQSGDDGYDDGFLSANYQRGGSFVTIYPSLISPAWEPDLFISRLAVYDVADTGDFTLGTGGRVDEWRPITIPTGSTPFISSAANTTSPTRVASDSIFVGPAVVFDGANDEAIVDDTTINVGTLFGVIRFASSGTQCIWSNYASNYRFRYVASTRTLQLGDPAGTSLSLVLPASAPLIGTFACIVNGASSKIYFNGYSASGDSGGSDIGNFGFVKFGIDNGATEWLNGALVHLGTARGVLSDGEFSILKNYAEERWGYAN